MTKLDQIRAAESKLLLTTYERFPVLFTHGEGVHIIDENGVAGYQAGQDIVIDLGSTATNLSSLSTANFVG